MSGNWQWIDTQGRVIKCFVCGTNEERLVPAALAIGREDFSVHNHSSRRSTYVCMPCGARVKSFTDLFGIETQ